MCGAPVHIECFWGHSLSPPQLLLTCVSMAKNRKKEKRRKKKKREKKKKLLSLAPSSPLGFHSFLPPPPPPLSLYLYLPHPPSLLSLFLLSPLPFSPSCSVLVSFLLLSYRQPVKNVKYPLAFSYYRQGKAIPSAPFVLVFLIVIASGTRGGW